MTVPTSPSTRRLAYRLLITVAVAAVCGRILSEQRVNEPNLARADPGRTAAAIVLPLAGHDGLGSAALLAGQQKYLAPLDPDGPQRPIWPTTRPEPTPTFSSNDRSRWATIRALVDERTYVIGRRDPTWVRPENKYGDEGIIFQDGWQSLDKVLKPETQEFYSSKPPLLPTLVAGEYWLLQRLFGWRLTDDFGRFTPGGWAVVRLVLLTVNALPLLLFWVLLARLVERFGSTDFGRLFVVAAACFGTLLTPFAITLNNHLVAACSALFALYPALAILAPARAEENRPTGAPAAPPGYLFALAGFFAAFTACNELPALSFAVLLLVVLLVRWPGRTLAWFVPAAAVPAAAFFLTNYLALGGLKPAYGEFGGPWYEYPGSYWDVKPGEVKRGIDWAGLKEDKATYAFHLLLGHHGLLSLTPILFLSLAGMAAATWWLVRSGRQALREVVFGEGTGQNHSLPPTALPSEGESREPRGHGWPPGFRLLGLGTGVLTVVVVGFYLVKTSNYGGWSTGPRWLLWLTPLWLLVLLPVVDWLAPRRWGRGLALAFLALSVLSASYPAWNPWRHPWIYNFMEAQHWIRY